MTFDPFTDEAIADPYIQYERFRRDDPVHWSEKLGSWLLFRHDDVNAFFRDDARLSSDRTKAAKFRGSRPSDGYEELRTVASDPPAHTPVRSMLTACLNPRVRALGPRIDEIIGALLSRIADTAASAAWNAKLEGEVDLIEEFASPLPINVIAELFGVPESERNQFRDTSHAIARGMDRFYSSGEADRGLRELGAYFYQLVQERRLSTGDDLVHRFLGAEYHGDCLSDFEAVALCTALVFGGHETTVNLIGNGMLALLQHPAQLEYLRANPSAIDVAVEELLRFDSPAQMISRTATVDFDWRGQRIRRADAVVAVLGSANRDPDVFETPDDLDLQRSPNLHLSFGLGTHFCPGAQLSRIEARAAITALLQRFHSIRLGSSPPRRRPTAVLRGFEHLPIQLV